MGYANILIFQGGVPEWKGKNLPVATGRQPGSYLLSR